MDQSITFKTKSKTVTFEPLDHDNEMEVRTEDDGVSISLYLTAGDMISLGGHLLRAGKKLANGKN